MIASKSGIASAFVVGVFVLLILPHGSGGPLTDGPPSDTMDPETLPCEPGHVPALGRACKIEEDHYAVFLADGEVLFTHGPDPIPPGGDVGFAMDAEKRTPRCATEHVMHVLYGRPASSPDRYEDVKQDLRDVVHRMNAVLNEDAVASGNVTADYNVVCDEEGRIEVGAFTGPETGGTAYSEDFSRVVDAARAAGYDRVGVNYLVFYDGLSTGVCGVANMAYDDRKSEDNSNLVGPDYGVTYQNCWFGRTPMHENAHNMGAVQRLAPMSDLAGHCLEGDDVMCYPYPTNFLIRCEGRIHFDCNHDTYFHTNPPEGSWLADHWNLGSRKNVYLTFDWERPTGPSADPEPETKHKPEQEPEKEPEHEPDHEPEPEPDARDNRTENKNETRETTETAPMADVQQNDPGTTESDTTKAQPRERPEPIPGAAPITMVAMVLVGTWMLAKRNTTR